MPLASAAALALGRRNGDHTPLLGCDGGAGIVAPCHDASKGGQIACSCLSRRRVLRRGRGVRNVHRLPRDQHGTRCRPHDVFCHTPQEHVGQPRPPMRPYDDEIHRLRARRVHNRLRGAPLDEEAIALEPGVLHPLHTRLQDTRDAAWASERKSSKAAPSVPTPKPQAAA